MSTFTPAKLGALFPLPSPPPASYSPLRHPGATPASSAELVRLLKLNHEKFHCFFNEKSFHNHLSHHLFAAYALGAPPDLLTEAYELHAAYQRPTWTSPSEITSANWPKHLGDENYYDSYLAFFTSEIESKGVEPTLEKYVFSNEANWANTKGEEKGPLMLARFFGGLLHPMIHLGHGVEFGIPGMVAEGLAMTAVHKANMAPMMPRDFFEETDAEEGATTSRPVTILSQMTSALRISQTKPKEPSAVATSYHGTHSFTILSRVLRDSSLAASQTCASDSNAKFTDTLASRGSVLRDYAKLWLVDGKNEKEVLEKLEELSWLVTILFGVGGWREGKKFKADFFTVHLLTSSLFLHSYIPFLSHRSRSLLLRGHFASQLTYYVSRGRPPLPLDAFLTSVTSIPVPPITPPKPSSSALLRSNPFADPWYSLLQSALQHSDEHLLKAQRALTHYATLYAPKPESRRGKFSGTELEGAESLDGEVFVRVSGLLQGALGWAREGEKEGGWDFGGLGWEHMWEPDYKGDHSETHE